MRNATKKILKGLAAIGFVAMIASCTEVCTIEMAGPVDTTSTVQQKNVLIEDITGVQCPNCPAGHVIVADLQLALPGRVETAAIHNGDLAQPLPYSQYDFRIPEGAQIDNYLGPADYWPKGAIDRKLYTGQSEVLIDRTFWTALTNQRLGDELKVSILLTNNYNDASRKLDIGVTLNYLTEVTDAQRINVYITESGLVDPQVFPTYIDTFYVQNNVLRMVLTAPQGGDPITEATISGAQINRNYSITLPNDLVANNCRVIVFVSNATTDSKEVLQVVGKDVK